MNIFKTASRFIIRKVFSLSVRIIRHCNDKKLYDAKLDDLRKYPSGTLGHDIAKCLDDNKLKFVPHFESHDL
jgi:ubiquinone biosynthesis protein Coq4